MTKSLAFPALIFILIVAWLAGKWSGFQFASITPADFTSRCGTLLVFALLIERTVEVVLTIWRGERANDLEATVRRLITAGSKPADNALVTAQASLREYKSNTLRLALPFSFTLGCVLACFGVRVLAQFVPDPKDLPPGSFQLHGFHTLDILFTAALLAGGADPIHKVMDTFRKFMESSSARASGTRSASPDGAPDPDPVPGATPPTV